MMSSLKVMVRLIATMIILSMGFVFYLQGSANAAKYCAELRGSTATGHPDCSFPTHKAYRAHVRAGGGPLLQVTPLGTPRRQGKTVAYVRRWLL